jgi:hypothetical protein
MRAQTHEVVHGATQAPPAGPDVAVLYTDVKPTLAALRKAAVLADGLHARIRLVVAQVVPYPLPLDRPDVAESYTARKLSTLLPDTAIETHIDLRLCRDRVEGLLPALQKESIVVLGTKKRRWWPTPEERLARRLEKHGLAVLVVAC